MVQKFQIQQQQLNVHFKEALQSFYGTSLPQGLDSAEEMQTKDDYLYYYLRYHFLDLSYLQPSLDPITVDFEWNLRA